MLVALITLQEEFVKYCARKGLDPATALPSVAKLAGCLDGVAETVGAKPAAPEQEPVAPEPPKAAAKPEPQPAPASRPEPASTPFSTFAQRYLDLRCEGFQLQRRHETADPVARPSFRASSRRNIEATVGLFIDVVGDLPVPDIQSHHCSEFVQLLSRIPSAHGKSSKNRMGVRESVADADIREAADVEAAGLRMRRAGRPPGEIEDARQAARIDRLRAGTCKRHMSDLSRLFDFAVFDGLRSDNPMKEHLWTPRETARRQHGETTVKREGWGDQIDALLASEIYRQPLKEPGDPLFWAPLLGIFAGLRMEEALQLRVEDFDTEGGVPFMRVRNTTGDQRLKSANSDRRVPLHRTLIDLGLLKLVALRRASGPGRIFPFLERGKAKGKFGEIFSKRFTHYRKRQGLNAPARDFHTLRTDFQTRLTHAQVPEHSRIALMGHGAKNITHAHYYRAGDPMPLLKEFVDRIDIDASGVMQPFAADEQGA